MKFSLLSHAIEFWSCPAVAEQDRRNVPCVWLENESRRNFLAGDTVTGNLIGLDYQIPIIIVVPMLLDTEQVRCNDDEVRKREPAS